MSKNDVFEIEVLGWEKHNGRQLKGKIAFTHFMVSARFFDDHKIATLTSLERLLYVAILARCCDERSSNIRPTRHQLLTNLGQTRYDIVTALMSLQRNQLVTLTKMPSFIKEKKRKEEKGKEKKGHQEIILDPKPVSDETNSSGSAGAAPPGKGNEIIKLYCDAWRAKYGANPPIDRKTAGQLNRLVKEFGSDRTTKIIEVYLKMKDSWFEKRRHDVSTMVTNLNAIAQYAATGKQVTSFDARGNEMQEYFKNQRERIERGEI